METARVRTSLWWLLRSVVAVCMLAGGTAPAYAKPLHANSFGYVSSTGMRASTAQPSKGPGFGLFVPGVPWDLSALSKLSSQLGHRPSTVMWYQQWSGSASFPASAASNVVAVGATPEITWEPWAAGKGVNQPAYSLAAIASGKYDGYIRTWATQIKAWGLPIR